MKLFILENFEFTSDRVLDRGGTLKTHWFNTLLLDGEILPTENDSERPFYEEVKHKLHSVLLPPSQTHPKVTLLPMYYSHSTLFRPILQQDGSPITSPSELGLVSGLPQCPPPGFCGSLEVRYIKSMPAIPTRNVSVYNPLQRRRKTKANAGGSRSCSVQQVGIVQDNNPQIFLTLGLREDGTMDIRLVGTLLEKLRILYGDNYTMKLEMKDLKLSKMYQAFQTPGADGLDPGSTSCRGYNLNEFITSFIVEDIKFKTDCPITHTFSCFGALAPSILSVSMQTAWNLGWFPVSATISLEVSFPPATDLLVKDRLKVNKRILQDGIETDAVIVAKNGATIQCHRAFLCATSSVFAGMFRSNMKESGTGRIELLSESERAIRALLSYIYQWDLEEPNKDIGLALELFQIAHQYDVKDLEVAVKNVLVTRPHQYFNLDVALDMFCYTRKLPMYTDLMEKAIRVVKFHAGSLDRSWKYKELFTYDIDSAKELCKFALLT